MRERWDNQEARACLTDSDDRGNSEDVDVDQQAEEEEEMEEEEEEEEEGGGEGGGRRRKRKRRKSKRRKRTIAREGVLGRGKGDLIFLMAKKRKGVSTYTSIRCCMWRS